jgi:HlyD family secretion protein
MKLKYTVIVAALIVLIVAYASFKANAPRIVDAARVTRGDVVEYVEERGRTRYRSEYTVSVLVSGFVLPIDFEEGNSVKKGQLLARVENIPYSTAVMEVQEEINRVKAMMKSVDAGKPKKEEKDNALKAIEIAKTQVDSSKRVLSSLQNAAETAKWAYENDKSLFENKVISEFQLKTKKDNYLAAQAAFEQQQKVMEIDSLRVETAEALLKLVTGYADDNEYQREAYKAQVKALESRLAKLKDDKEKTSVHSPIDGIILKRYSRGNSVMPAGTELFLLGDPTSIEVSVELLTDDVSKVKLKDRVILSGEVLRDRSIEGEVDRILPTGFLKRSTLGVEQERVGVICSFDNSELGLGPVYGVDVRIITDERKGVLRIPERAVFKSGGRQKAFVIRNGVAALAEIEIGLEGEDYYEVVSGLSENDIVLVAPPADLKQDMKVEPSGL